MNTRYGHSPVARAVVGISLAASIIGSAGFASAKTCTFAFPTPRQPCGPQGTALAQAAHSKGIHGGQLLYQLTVDMQGGSFIAYAYGIDVNGDHLNDCIHTAADDAPQQDVFSTVSCQDLYGTPGAMASTIFYSHPAEMQSTFVVVL
jgi:hypothetical protein